MKYIKGLLLTAVVVLIIVNQVHLTHAMVMLGMESTMSGMIDSIGSTSNATTRSDQDLSNVDLAVIQSTAQGVAAIFPMDQIQTSADAVAMMLPTGTPSYGAAMGVTFDDAIGSLATLAKAQRPLLASLTPAEKDRFINLASMPVGISCEYCCGLQAVGINDDGSSACGCQHNPALLSVTMWLMQNTDYTDAEILREVYQWKSLFFPKDMVQLATSIAGGDESVLQELPGMVGGC